MDIEETGPWEELFILKMKRDFSAFQYNDWQKKKPCFPGSLAICRVTYVEFVYQFSAIIYAFHWVMQIFQYNFITSLSVSFRLIYVPLQK